MSDTTCSYNQIHGAFNRREIRFRFFRYMSNRIVFLLFFDLECLLKHWAYVTLHSIKIQSKLLLSFSYLKNALKRN